MGCTPSKEKTTEPQSPAVSCEKPAEKPAEQSVEETTAAAESKNDMTENLEDVKTAEAVPSDNPPSPSKAATNKPFSINTTEDVVITSTEEDQTDHVQHLTSEEDIAVAIDSIPESTAPTEEPPAAEEEQMPAPVVKRTSVKDRIKRVNSMERRSTSGRYAPDSPLLSQKLEYDYLIKMVLLGDLAVGKSSLQVQFVEDSYKSWYKSTVGTDFKFKTCISEEGKRLKIQLWDSSGKERLQGTSKEFFLKMLGFVLVFDVTNEESFNNIKSTWYKKTELPTGTVHDPLTVRVLVGNKAEDSYDEGVERKITYEQGEELAKELGVTYFETSAKSGKEVKDMFMLCANEIVDRIQENGEIYEKYKQTLY